MAKKPKTRPIRPAARSFDHFPEDSVCPICRTSDDGECVLVQIDGTGDGKIAEAAPMHMSCARCICRVRWRAISTRWSASSTGGCHDLPI